jgi:hypothetical protein
VFFTADDVKSFRTLDLEPGLKLLGFKDSTELAFEDNIKHSLFIYPDEAVRVKSTYLPMYVQLDGAHDRPTTGVREHLAPC